MSEVQRVLGVDLPIEECARILKTLEFGVEVVGRESIKATVPTHRLDIQEGPADLIEDMLVMVHLQAGDLGLFMEKVAPQFRRETVAPRAGASASSGSSSPTAVDATSSRPAARC